MTIIRKHLPPDECESCGFHTNHLKLSYDGFGRERVYLCTLCANSEAGNMVIYPNNYSPEQKILGRLIMNAANQIIAAFKGQEGQ